MYSANITYAFAPVLLQNQFTSSYLANPYVIIVIGPHITHTDTHHTRETTRNVNAIIIVRAHLCGIA